LEGALSGEPMQPNRDAVVISYWWDWTGCKVAGASGDVLIWQEV
jgi:hypothetical protein